METSTPVLEFSRRFLEYRYLPAVLAIGAVLVMLPALNTGLVMDDLMQRSVELRPAQLPPGMHETGNPLDSGSFATVLCDLFGSSRDPRYLALAKNYGRLPWWTPDDLKVCLWRPVTALTHWLDYRLFPDAPALMHAHNITWFASIVFLVTMVYARLMGVGWPAGLAALLFLLDSNTYFPVMYVANRGFLISLFFGLLCLYQHHQWRSAKSSAAPGLASLFLAMSLFANEGGVSTFAFILAYALVLEAGPIRGRAWTVLPSILVIVLWQIIYRSLGFGVFHMGGYIDPANEPLLFARTVVPRMIALLGGQLAGLAPDIVFALSPSWQWKFGIILCVAAAVGLIGFIPLARRDKIAGFWFAAMLLAAIPAATVMPTGKNLGFVAVGAYGLIASLVADLIRWSNRTTQSPLLRKVLWGICLLLMVAHVPGAIAGRFVSAQVLPWFVGAMNRLSDVGDSADLENQHVIVVNAPCEFGLATAPSYKAFHRQPLPRSIRTLVPGGTGFGVERTDEKTLLIQARAPNIFSCDDVGRVHFAYLFRTLNLFLGEPRSKKGDRYLLSGLTVDVLEVDKSDLPSQVAFRFENSLDSPDFHWLRFDWLTLSYRPFIIPAIGQTVTLPGP